MDITIPQEGLAALGAALLAFAIAFTWLLVWAIRHLTSISKALERGSAVNAALNDELLDVIKERNRERQERDEARRVLLKSFDEERATFRREIATVRQEAEDANKTLTDELIKVKGKLTQYENSIRSLSLENTRLEIRITELVEEGKIKDKKIAQLEQRLLTKQDKPGTGELSEQVEKVAAKVDDDPPAPDNATHIDQKSTELVNVSEPDEGPDTASTDAAEKQEDHDG